MTPATRKLALRAAAKVTLAGALLGCENTPPQNAEAVRVPPSDPTTVNTGPDPAPPSTPSAPTIASGQCGTDPNNKADVSCCLDAVGAVTADGGAVKTGNAIACCKALIDPNSGAGWFRPGHDECCQALHYPRGTSCTPWGPPVPPSMGWA